MAKVFIEETTLTAIGDAIREKEGTTALVPVNDMATRISAIQGGGGGADIPEEAFLATGNCAYRFANGGWDWFLNSYINKLTTINILNADHMFSATAISEIPFDINLQAGNDNISCAYIFSNAAIEKAPYIVGRVNHLDHCFYFCESLRDIPEDWASYIDWTRLHSYSNAGLSYMFAYAYSLKDIPVSLLAEVWGTGNSSTSVPYYCMFQACYALGELKGIAVHKGTMTTNRCTSMFSKCERLKSVTFAVQAEGTPIAASWKSQTLDLSELGYTSNITRITGYNSGITADKEVKDDATYQALKNDPDWFTTKVEYSRYNHDSAVETINSLPDTSAYGTNTIKFKKVSGSKTDGGAIENLTEAEIAVAAAKGWTVTLS